MIQLLKRFLVMAMPLLKYPTPIPHVDQLMCTILFLSMLQIEPEDIISVLGETDESEGQTDRPTDGRTPGQTDILGLSIELSSDSNDSELLSSIIYSDLDIELIPSTSDLQPTESSNSNITSESLISNVAQFLSDDTVSYLIKESLRSKVSSRASVSSTSSVENTVEQHGEDQVPTKEDLLRKERRRKFNREWAKRDRNRRKTKEENLQQRIERLESENQELEKEIACLKDEARELKACFYLHQQFYHPE